MMANRYRIFVLALALAGAGIAGAALGADQGPFIRMDSSVDLEIDLATVRADLLPPLLEAARTDSTDWSQNLEMILGLVGVPALKNLRLESTQSLVSGSSKLTLSLADGVDGGLLGALMSVPDRPCRFARRVPADEVAVFASLQNLPGNLGALLDFAASPQLREMIPAEVWNADGELALGPFCPRTDLLPLLAGEIDIVVLDAPEDAPLRLVVAVAARGGAELRDAILEIAGTMGGEEMAMMSAMFADLPVEDVGGFSYSLLPTGQALATSADFLVFGTDPESLRDILARSDGGLQVPDGRSWLRASGEAYAQFLMQYADLAGELQDQDALIPLQALREAAKRSLTAVEVRTSCSPGRLVVESVSEGSAVMLSYEMIRMMAAEAPKMAAMAAEKRTEARLEGKYSAIVSNLDQAFVVYAAEHEGFYPADPHELVDVGYLDAFPELTPTPLGEYLADGYTYVPLRDGDGNVAGYYFFVYGVGPDRGHDVFTPLNVLDPDRFAIGADGEPDGVASFCYDGLALDQVREWQQW